MYLLTSLLLFTILHEHLTAHEDFGGHSREFRSIHQPIDWDLMAAKHRNVRSVIRTQNSSFLPSDEEIREFIYSHKDAKEVLLHDIEQILNDAWVYVSVRIKGFESLRNKLIRKNDTLSRIKDTIGVRLTLQSVSDVREIKELLIRSQKKFTIEEIRCYGICHPDMKFTNDGYRRIHLKVKVDEFEKWAEIQIGTPFCDEWADWSHDLLYKGKFAKRKEPSAHSYAFKLAEYFYKLDEMRDKMVSCPGKLSRANAKEELNEDAYIALHKPKSLCFYWTDIFLEKPTNSQLESASLTVNDEINSNLLSNSTFEPRSTSGSGKIDFLNFVIFLLIFLYV